VPLYGRSHFNCTRSLNVPILIKLILHQAAGKHSERRMKSPDRGKQRKNEAAHKWF